MKNVCLHALPQRFEADSNRPAWSAHAPRLLQSGSLTGKETQWDLDEICRMSWYHPIARRRHGAEMPSHRFSARKLQCWQRPLARGRGLVFFQSQFDELAAFDSA